MNQQPNDKQTICIVIPCYNEEEVLPWAMGKLQTMIGKMKAETASRDVCCLWTTVAATALGSL